MSAGLLLLLLATPVGTIRVQVRGAEGGAGAPSGVEVFALRDGAVVSRAPASGGVALLTGLRAGEYDLFARGARSASRVERGVRCVADGAAGIDAVLTLRPVFPVKLATERGATVYNGGRAHAPGELSLPAGIHRLIVDHPRRVSSASRLVRVSGPVELEIPLEPGLVLLGRVVDADGAPVAGARVEAFADGFSSGRWTLTDAAGAFGLSGFRGDVVSVRVRARGFADALERVAFYPGSERARVEVGLRAGSSVVLRAGTVVEAVLLPRWYEQALEERRLRANHAPLRLTGRRIRFNGLAPGRTYRLLLSAPGRRPAATEPFVAPPAGTTLELPPVAPRPGAVIFGVAKPGAGTTVVCVGPEGRRVCRADRAGRYEFTGLDPGDHGVFLRDLDEQPRPVALEEGARQRLDLEAAAPDPARAIEGVVTDADGRPLAGVEAEVAGRRTVSDAQGAFSFTGLPRGRDAHDVRFRPGAGCRALIDDPHLPLTRPRVPVGAKLRVPLARAATLRLRFDTQGHPLARASLILAQGGGAVRRIRLPRRSTGAAIPELALGNYEIDVAAPGFLGTGGVLVPHQREDAQPTVLGIARGRRAAGRVVLRRTEPSPAGPPRTIDSPLRRGWVCLLDPRPARVLAVASVEEDGSFVLDGLPLQRVILCAGVPGLPPARVDVDLSEADRKELVIPLQEGVKAGVIVTGDEDRPLPDARVRILDMIRPDSGWDVRDLAALARFRRVVAGERDFDEIGPTFVWTRTRDGHVEARFVAPGSYDFQVSAPGYRTVQVGVRARTAWQVKQILKNVPDVPGGDLTPRVRMAREAKD